MSIKKSTFVFSFMIVVSSYAIAGVSINFGNISFENPNNTVGYICTDIAGPARLGSISARVNAICGSLGATQAILERSAQDERDPSTRFQCLDEKNLKMLIPEALKSWTDNGQSCS